MLRSRLARLIDPFTSGISFILLRLLLIVYQFQNGIQSTAETSVHKFELSEMVDVRGPLGDRRLFIYLFYCLRSKQKAQLCFLFNQSSSNNRSATQSSNPRKCVCYASFGKASLKACLLSYSLFEVSRGVSVVWPRRIHVIGRLFCPQIKWKN
ncbi:putative parathyroid hormone 2 receptor [Trichinella spiralis]|uniref:putative parathyroid hormone 2 receptor n=1 Tax=Trichinella spiralis TaxID=6334 RepID=UPI0001EFCC33|nr:putative parathyroid hormone 2 receptor [Trichinella spiralis]